MRFRATTRGREGPAVDCCDDQDIENARDVALTIIGAVSTGNADRLVKGVRRYPRETSGPAKTSAVSWWVDTACIETGRERKR